MEKKPALTFQELQLKTGQPVYDSYSSSWVIWDNLYEYNLEFAGRFFDYETKGE